MKLPEYGQGPYWLIIKIAFGIAIPAAIIKEVLDDPNQFENTDWIMTATAFTVLVAVAIICYVVVKRNNQR